MAYTRADVLAFTLDRLADLTRDLDLPGEIGEQTTLMDGLGFESLDIVVLAETFQTHYGQLFPFTDFFAQVGASSATDITVAQWVDFIYTHLEDRT